MTSLGAEEIPRDKFLAELERALKLSGHPGHWQTEIVLQDLVDTGNHL